MDGGVGKEGLEFEPSAISAERLRIARPWTPAKREPLREQVEFEPSWEEDE
jgi:hypothetical protein